MVKHGWSHSNFQYQSVLVSMVFVFLGFHQGSNAQPLEQVSAEKFNLVFNSRSNSGNTAFYADIPDSFPEFHVRDVFNVRVAYELGGNLGVVLGTSLSRSEAIDTLVADYTATGHWFRYEYPRNEPQGFTVERRIENISLCHDTLPGLSVRSIEQESSVFLQLTTYRSGNHRTCTEVMMEIDQIQQLRAETMNEAMGLSDYLPVLKIPGELLGSTTQGGGGYASGRFVESQFRAKINLPLSELKDHFAAQMLEQDWIQDIDFVGEQTAGGSWIFDKEVNPPINGIMTLIKKPNDSYDLYFRLIQ